MEQLELDVARHPLIGTVISVSSLPRPMVTVRLDVVGTEEGGVLSDVLWVSGQELGGLRLRFTRPVVGARVLVEQGNGRFGGVEWVIGGVVSAADTSAIGEFETDISATTGVDDPDMLDVARSGAFVIGIGKSSSSKTRAEGAYLVIEDRRVRIVVEGDYDDDNGRRKHGRNVFEMVPGGLSQSAPARNVFTDRRPPS